jgi:hypothetical protein
MSILKQVRMTSVDSMHSTHSGSSGPSGPSGSSDPIDFAAKQVLLLSLYRDKNVKIRQDYDSEMKKIRDQIGDFIQGADNFLIKNALRDIADLYYEEKMKMEDAIDQSLLAILLGDVEYIHRDEPKRELQKLIQDIKQVLHKFKRQEIDQELPVRFYQDLAMDIYEYTVSDKWITTGEPEKQQNDKRTEEKIAVIAERYSTNQAISELAVSKLTEHHREKGDTIFINKLYLMNDNDLSETLDSWLDIEGEVSNLFDLVKQEGPMKQEDQREMHIDKEEFKQFKIAYFEKERRDTKYVKIRDDYAKMMNNMFKKHGKPVNYTKSDDITQDYIRKTLLPYIMYFYRKLPKTLETYAYGGYIYRYLTNQVGLTKDKFPSNLRGFVKKYIEMNGL